ncbi:MAG: type II toxin-antitoxin system HicA family toxin [Bryobacteraceae bacterium]
MKALGKAGFRLRRQEGSHMILRRYEPFAQVVVPDHKELHRGTFSARVRPLAFPQSLCDSRRML